MRAEKGLARKPEQIRTRKSFHEDEELKKLHEELHEADSKDERKAIRKKIRERLGTLREDDPDGWAIHHRPFGNGPPDLGPDHGLRPQNDNGPPIPPRHPQHMDVEDLDVESVRRDNRLRRAKQGTPDHLPQSAAAWLPCVVWIFYFVDVSCSLHSPRSPRRR